MEIMTCMNKSSLLSLKYSCMWDMIIFRINLTISFSILDCILIYVDFLHNIKLAESNVFYEMVELTQTVLFTY